MAGGLDARAGVDDRTEVVPAAFLGLAEVEAHAHLEDRPRPGRGREIVLGCDGGLDRGRRL